MFLQEKEYMQLLRANKPFMTAGLCKSVIWDQKIKVDFYLDHLPIAEQTKGIFCMQYLIRKEGEDGLIKMEVKEPFVFSKANQCYSWTKREMGTNRIVKLERLFLAFEEEYLICSKKDIPLLVTKSVESNESYLAETEKQEWLDEEEKDADITVEKDIVNEEVREEKASIRKIEDIRQLLELSQEYAELYYNSFLLHSYYQYRYVLIGKDFIGVPDYFYEREAIAAKMMGFPYFVKAEDIETVSFSKQYDRQMPKDGTYGYFLKHMQ